MAVRRLILFAALAASLTLAAPAWAGSTSIPRQRFCTGQGALSFTPGLGNALTIGAGGGGNGALVTDFFNTDGHLRWGLLHRRRLHDADNWGRNRRYGWRRCVQLQLWWRRDDKGCR